MGVDHRENHATQLGEIIPQTRFGVSNLGLNLVLNPKLRGVPGGSEQGKLRPDGTRESLNDDWTVKDLGTSAFVECDLQ